jgi:hypothetical protein
MEGRIRRGVGLEPLLHVGIAGGIDQDAAGADARQLLLLGADAAIGGQFIEHLHGGLGIALLHFRGEAKSRQQAIAVWRFRHEIGERGLGLAVLVLLGELDRLVEGIAGFRGLLGLQILIAAPAADGGDDQDRHGDNIERVLVPELLELLAADFLVYFIK